MKLASLLSLLLPLLALAASTTTSAPYQQGDASEETDVRNVSSFKSTAMVSVYACTLNDSILQSISCLSNCVRLLDLILFCPLHYTLTKTLSQHCFILFRLLFVNQELRRLRETRTYDANIVKGLQGKCQCEFGSSWSESIKHTRTKNESNCSRKRREQIRSSSRSCLGK
jgi:hypothetical protein